jgi:hypothetical protein
LPARGIDAAVAAPPPTHAASTASANTRPRPPCTRRTAIRQPARWRTTLSLEHSGALDAIALQTLTLTSLDARSSGPDATLPDGSGQPRLGDGPKQNELGTRPITHRRFRGAGQRAAGPVPHRRPAEQRDFRFARRGPLCRRCARRYGFPSPSDSANQRLRHIRIGRRPSVRARVRHKTAVTPRLREPGRRASDSWTWQRSGIRRSSRCPGTMRMQVTEATTKLRQGKAEVAVESPTRLLPGTPPATSKWRNRLTPVMPLGLTGGADLGKQEPVQTTPRFYSRVKGAVSVAVSDRTPGPGGSARPIARPRAMVARRRRGPLQHHIAHNDQRTSLHPLLAPGRRGLTGC